MVEELIRNFYDKEGYLKEEANVCFTRERYGCNYF